MKNQKGFSLIELLIVVVIIGIIAAIAIPNLLASRRAANEATVISSLRTYHGAQATYQSTTGNGNYAGIAYVQNAFPVLASVNLLDSQLGEGIKNGYVYAAHSFPRTGNAPACHLGQAYPTAMSGVTATGTRNFVIATEGVMHAAAATTTAGYAGNDGLELCTVNSIFSPVKE